MLLLLLLFRWVLFNADGLLKFFLSLSVLEWRFCVRTKKIIVKLLGTLELRPKCMQLYRVRSKKCSLKKITTKIQCELVLSTVKSVYFTFFFFFEMIYLLGFLVSIENCSFLLFTMRWFICWMKSSLFCPEKKIFLHAVRFDSIMKLNNLSKLIKSRKLNRNSLIDWMQSITQRT